MSNKINVLFWLILGTFAGTILLRSEILALPYAVIALVVIVLAVFLHGRKGREDERYLLNVIGLSGQKPRVPQYDYLRVLAMVMVIITHAIQADFALGQIQGEALTYVMELLSVFCMCCNTVYVMLSGALLLPDREESLVTFYAKRISSVAIPMAVYLLFYRWQFGGLQYGSAAEMKEILRLLYVGNISEAPHFWLIHVILGLYVVMPFLRRMCKNLPYGWVTAFVGIGVLWMTLNTFVDTLAYDSFISGWVSVAVAGYWVTREETRKYDRWIIAAGGVSLVLMAVIISATDNFMQLCCNCSPISVIITMGVFCIVLRGKRMFGRGGRLLSFLSRHSYSVILMHWWSLNLRAIGVFRIEVGWGYGLGLPASLAVTLIWALAAGFILDNLFVVVVREAFERVMSAVAKRKNPVRSEEN